MLVHAATASTMLGRRAVRVTMAQRKCNESNQNTVYHHVFLNKRGIAYSSSFSYARWKVLDNPRIFQHIYVYPNNIQLA